MGATLSQEGVAMKKKPYRLIWLLMCASAALALGGCVGTIYPEDGENPTDQFLIQALELSGTTQDDCAVVVEDVTDGDGLDDKQWRAGFALDGTGGAGSLPRDAGEEQHFVLGIKATRESDGQVLYKKVTVTLYD
jgi:hypothetical protein